MFPLNRRHFLGLGAAGLCMPQSVLASEGSDRLFLLIFVRGGWDPTFVFTNQADNPFVYTPPFTELATNAAIPYMNSVLRPSVNTFFRSYGDRVCLVNGIEVASLTHDACRRIIFTGQAGAGKDDWPAIIGAHSGFDLPVMVVSGPSFTSQYSQAVVRAGEDGQLAGLLDGTALEKSDVPLNGLSGIGSHRVQQYLQRRAEDLQSLSGAGREHRFISDLLGCYAQRDAALTLDGFELGSATGFTSVPTQIEAAISTLTSGMSKCLVIEHNGLYESGWDHHSNIDSQTHHFDLLFNDLNWLMGRLSTWGLEDRLTVCVFSEMGRAPQLNPISGKDHWTFTSAMFMGAGVRGGQVIGGYDAGLVGQRVDPIDGGLDPNGTALSSLHFGATLLALSGIDPEEYLPGISPIYAAINNS